MWERNYADEAHPLDTFTMITCAPNDVMKPIHHRMPVVLHQRNSDQWVDRNADPEKLKALLVPFDGDMEAVPIRRVGNCEPSVLDTHFTVNSRSSGVTRVS